MNRRCANNDLPMLNVRVQGIIENISQWVAKYRNCLIESHLVFTKIAISFSRVPCKPHVLSIAYAKNNQLRMFRCFA